MSVAEKEQVYGEERTMMREGIIGKDERTDPRTRSNLSDCGEGGAWLWHNINSLLVGRKRKCDIHRIHELDS